MLSAAFMMLFSNAFFMLRVGEKSGSFPKPLSAAEERECVKRLMQGDMEARSILIEHNMRLVAHIIKKYYSQTDDQDDLISIGTIGLIKGISTYKPDKGVRLATYVSRCIENEILMYFRSMKKTAGDLSLSDTIETDGDGNSLSLIDVVCTKEDMFERIDLAEDHIMLRGFIADCLTDTERQIVSLRYGLKDGRERTQREVAAICGISRSYVSRIEKRAIEKLRECFRKAGC